MSSGDDTRVLNMQINNKAFLSGTADSLKAIDSLNKGIDGAGKGKGMSTLGSSVDTVKTKFSALQVAGITALANITNRAVNAGINLAKSFTITPILEGFREYEKLLTSTQTIAANTGLTGKKGLGQVNDALDDLNVYADQTIYNFGQMADSIGKFTAAGGKGSLKPSVDAIKGMANAAALAGSDVNQLNTAMYQMSQAMATGTIKLMDWNSLSNAGMGGKNMQNTLKLTASTFDGLGTKMEEAIKKNGSFRESLSEGWLTADVFSKAMKVMGGVTADSFENVKEMTDKGYSPMAIEALKAGKSVAYSVKQLRQMGYSKEAAIQLNKLSQSAIESATKIKTFTQLIDVVKESIGSGWSQIFRALFGDLREAGKLWTTVGDAITGVIDRGFGALSGVLQEWRSLGGYTKLWAGFGNIFKTIGNLLRPFVVLIGSILPSTGSAGKGMYNMTNAFYQFSVVLEKGTRNLEFLNPVFETLGQVIGFVFKAVWGLIQSYVGLFKIFVPLGEAIGSLVLKLFDMAKGLQETAGMGSGIGDLFAKFVELRDRALTPIVETLTAIVNSLKTLAGGDISGFKEQFKGAFSNLIPLKDLFNQGVNAAKDMIAGLKQGWESGDIQSTVSKFVNKFLDFFKGLLGINSPSTVFEQYGKDILQGLANGLSDFASFIGNGIKNLVKFLVDGIKGIDKFDLANIISGIFSVGAILMIRKFMTAFGNVGVGMKEVLGSASGAFESFSDTMGAVQKNLQSKTILNYAIAIGLLAASLWVLSKIPYERLAVGTVAIGAMFAMLTLSMKALTKFAATTKTGVASMVAMGTAMGIMAASILLLTAAVFAFGKMDIGVLKQGMIAIAVAMTVLSVGAIALGKAGPWMAVAALGLVGVATSLIILAAALRLMIPVITAYAKMDFKTLASGLLKMGVVLYGLGLALGPLAALGPVLLATSVSLLILSVSLRALAGTLERYSEMEWGTVFGGVAKMAVALVALGLAALVAAPGIVALGIGTALFGAGLLAAGVGMGLFAAGFTAFAAAGVAGATTLFVAFQAFLGMLPLIGIQIVSALDSILNALAEKAPSIIDSLVTIISEALRGIRELAPELVETGFSLLQSLIEGIWNQRVWLFTTATDLILGLLQHINEQLPKFITVGVSILTSLIEGFGNNAAKIAAASAVAILQFLRSIRQTVEQNTEPMVTEGRKIAQALVVGIVKGLIPEPIRRGFSTLVRNVVNFFKNLLGIRSPSRVFMGFGKDIVTGLANGITSLIGKAKQAIVNLVTNVVNKARELPGKVRSAISSLGSVMGKIFSSAFRTVTGLVSTGVRNIQTSVTKIPGIIRGIISSVGSAAKSVGKAIIDGIVGGIRSVVGTVMDLGTSLVNGLKSGINSALNLPFHIPEFPIKVGFGKASKTFTVGGQLLIPAFARGVTGFGGGSALVGEAGPELVTMGRGSNVITNEILTKFIKQVSKFTKAMMSGSNSKNSPGGSVQYVVSSKFRGDPRRDGVKFASEIANGLIQGMKAQQSAVSSSATNMAKGASTSFAKELGIQSPSKVFRTFGINMTKGLIQGITKSVVDVKKAIKTLGSYASKEMRRAVTDSRLRLAALNARADALENTADELRIKARKAKTKKLKDALKERAKELDRLARKANRAASTQAKKVSAAEAAAERSAQYNKYKKDENYAGMASMKREDAESAARRAAAARENVLRLRREAKLIQKYDKKRAKKLRDDALTQMKKSKTYADQAEARAKEARNLQTKADDKAAKAREEAKKNEAAESGEASIDQQMASVSAKDIAKAKAAFDSYAKSLIEAEAAAREDILPSEFKFEQNNYSPEAISPAEAYRNGKSLVSIMERKLTPTP